MAFFKPNSLTSRNYTLLFPVGAVVADCEILGSPKIREASASKKSATVIKVRHKCGHVFNAVCSNIARGTSGCPHCAPEKVRNESVAHHVGKTFGTYTVTAARIMGTARTTILTLQCTKCGIEGDQRLSNIKNPDSSGSTPRRFDPNHCPRCELIKKGILKLPKQQTTPPDKSREAMDALLAEIREPEQDSYINLLEA